MGRVLFSSLNLFFSIIVGAVMLAYIMVNFPDFANDILGAAAQVQDWLNGIGIPSKYNVWVIFLIGEQQIVFVFFVILARIIMSSLAGLFRMAVSR